MKDTPTMRASIETLTDDELDAMLESIRERRLKLVQQMVELEAAKHAAKREVISGKVSKHFAMLKKELTKVDNDIEKISARLLKIRALRLELDW
ncbi:hypothetical protein HC928_05060 [bacterium]|nr:hypothetical protein [bacterium]